MSFARQPSLFGWLSCLLHGHHYHPAYEQARGKAQYSCECCGSLTPWMTPQEHREFQAECKPTWGDRGSNSQGY